MNPKDPFKVTVNTQLPEGVARQLKTCMLSEADPPDGMVNVSVLLPVLAKLTTGPYVGSGLFGVMVAVTVPDQPLMPDSVINVEFNIVRGVT